MAAISLPQLSLLPNITNILSGIAQVTGLTSALDALNSAKNIVKVGDYTPATIDAFLNDLKALLASVGSFVPGGVFATLQDEIAKFEAVVASVESGQPTTVADVTYTSRSGQEFSLVLSLTVKPEVAPVEAAPVA